MSWHYQIVKYKDGGMGLHEVYGAKGEISHTEEPVSFVGSSVEEIIESLRMALADAEKRPPIKELP